MSKHQTKLDAALGYAAKGWPVHPLKGKRPILKNWPALATSDADQISRWFKKYRDANVGIVTEKFIVIDCDDKNGRNGTASLQLLETEIGELPTTYTVRTPNGYHYYFSGIRTDIPNSVGRLGAGLDIKSRRGYVVAPPSVVEGVEYRIHRDAPIAALPKRWAAYIISRSVSSSFDIPQGTRDETLFREACRFRAKGFDFDKALEVVTTINKTKCAPPLGDEQVIKCVRSAFKYPRGYELNDRGNAQRLLEASDGRLIYVPDVDSFYVFDGRRWIKDRNDLISLGLLKSANQLIHAEASLIEDEKLRAKTERFAISSQNTSRLKAAIDNLKSEIGVAVSLEELDADPLMLGVQNGVVDLRTGEFREMRPDDMITKLANASYDHNAKCPEWIRFIGRVFGNDGDLIRYVQQANGYSLTGDTSEQVLFAVFGPAATGKSTLLEVVADILGDYAGNMRTDALMAGAKRAGGPSEDEARLVGVRYLTTSETSDGARFNQSLIKDLTGGDRITARELFKSSIEFVPQFKLWIRGNHRPVFDGEDTGMARRIRLVPMTQQIPKSAMDKNLASKLRNERTGILNWLIDGALQWRNTGLVDPKAVRDSTAAYVAEMDIAGAFVDQCCRRDPAARTPFSRLFQRYGIWCSHNGHAAKSRHAFAEQLSIRGFKETRFRNNGKLVRGRIGIRLKPFKLPRRRDTVNDQ